MKSLPSPSPPARPPPQPRLSDYSFSSVIDTGWASVDFMLSAGMVIIQEETHLVVVVHDRERDRWIFPRARKDLGESLENTALRAAYEVSDCEPIFLPLRNPSRHAASTGQNTDPVYMTVDAWQPQKLLNGACDDGGEHLTTWYVGTIPEAIRNGGTGMSNELMYPTHLFSYEEALQKVPESEGRVLRYVWYLYFYTRQYL